MCKGPSANAQLTSKNSGFFTSNTQKVSITGDQGKVYAKDAELYLQLAGQCNQYVVIAKNGSMIPCVPVQAFDAIFKELPDILVALRRTGACTHANDGVGATYRESHSNDSSNLPEYMLTNHRTRSRETIAASIRSGAQIPAREPYFKTTWLVGQKRPNMKWQQLQEYDCISILDKLGNKLFEDKGALRIVVDESFEEVYVCTNHYRNILLGKGQKNEDFSAVNPFIYVFFPDAMNWSVNLTKNAAKKKGDAKVEQKSSKQEEKTKIISSKNLFQSSANAKAEKKTEAYKQQKQYEEEYSEMIKRDSNKVGVSDRTIDYDSKASYTFLGKPVDIIAPAFCKRQRRDSFSIAKPIMSDDAEPEALQQFYL